MPSISPHKLSCTVNGGGAPGALPLEGEPSKTQNLTRRLRALWTGAQLHENERAPAAYPPRAQRR